MLIMIIEAKDFIIETKAKATLLCPSGISRPRPCPYGHITAYKHDICQQVFSYNMFKLHTVGLMIH